MSIQGCRSCEQEALRGQGLVLEMSSPDPLQPPQEIGGRIMACESIGRDRLRLRLGPGRCDVASLKPGASVWLTSDPQWAQHWEKRARADVPVADRSLSCEVVGVLGQPLQLRLLEPRARDEGAIVVESEIPLQEASQRPLDRGRLSDQLGRLGERLTLGSLQLDLCPNAFLPVAELN